MIPCFIVARARSERFPGKHFEFVYHRMPMLEFVVKRCEFFGLKPYVCIPKDEYDRFFGITTCLDIFEGDPDNVEARVLECAHHYQIKAFHQLDADDPLFDPFAVLDSFNASQAGRLWRVTPSYHSRAGSGRMGTTYNLSSPTGGDRNLLDTLQNYPWPQRLTVDYPEDLCLVRMVAETLGGYMAPRSAVDELFIKNPDLHRVNWFRNQEWKAHQDAETRWRNRSQSDPGDCQNRIESSSKQNQ